MIVRGIFQRGHFELKSTVKHSFTSMGEELDQYWALLKIPFSIHLCSIFPLKGSQIGTLQEPAESLKCSHRWGTIWHLFNTTQQCRAESDKYHSNAFQTHILFFEGKDTLLPQIAQIFVIQSKERLKGSAWNRAQTKTSQTQFNMAKQLDSIA